jgi:hypothetical protein
MAGKKSRKPIESVDGRYSALPHKVLDSLAYTGASLRAKAMLVELVRQHSGDNNGRFQATFQWLKRRGWSSKYVIQKALAELVERQLIVLTKHGGLNAGATFYAVTWLQITRFDGLDILRKDYWPGNWAMCSAAPAASSRRVKKRGSLPGSRASTTPIAGEASIMTAPTTGPKTREFRNTPAPVDGNNECIPLPPNAVSAQQPEANRPRASRKRANAPTDQNVAPTARV